MIKAHSDRTVLVLAGAELLGAIGMQIAVFALPLAALEVFDASPMQVACLNLMESAAALAFGLVVAAFIDRVPGATAITIANALRLIGCASVALSLYACPAFAILFVCFFILGVSNLINEAGVNSTIVSVVGRNTQSLNRANSLLRSSGVISELGGIALGGIVVSVLTFATTMAVGGVSFGLALGLSLILWVGLRRSGKLGEYFSRARADAVDESSSELHGSSLRGLRYIFGSIFLKRLTLTSFHFNFFSAVFQAGFVVYCVQVLGFRPWALSVVGVAGAIGGLVGAVAASTSFSSERARGIYALSIGLPALSIALMLASQLSESTLVRVSIVGLAEFIFGLCMVLCIVLFNTARQQCSPDSMVGEISATERTIALAGEVPGFLIGGVLATAFSLQLAMWVAVAGIVFAPAWLWRLRVWPSEAGIGSTTVEKEIV